VTIYGRSCLRNWSVATTPRQPSALTFEPSSTAPDTSTVPRINSVQNIFASIRRPCFLVGAGIPRVARHFSMIRGGTSRGQYSHGDRYPVPVESQEPPVTV